MSVTSDWREALVSHLRDAFPEAEVISGQRQGVSRDRDRICVFLDPAPQGHLGDRVVVATPRMIVRYWKSESKIPDTTWPSDPIELEQARDDLLNALRQVQELPTLVRPWYFQVESSVVDPDPEEWGVEARLVAYTANEAVIA